jgi:TRAP-type C4-dicarboxylate transport system permease small subunit
MFKWFDDNIEKTVILVSYVVMAGIIFVEVIRRFALGQQAAWSSTIPIYLFLWVTWIGCAYCCKTRSHLRFDEVRTRLSYRGQFICMLIDHFVWIGFSILIMVFSIEQVQIARDNFAIVAGTDDIMQWWFYLATPIGFLLIIYRTLRNLIEDIQRFQRGEPMLISTSRAAD